MCTPGTGKVTTVKVDSFDHFIGRVMQYFNYLHDDNDRKPGFSSYREYEFDCGQVYKITVERIK